MPIPLALLASQADKVEVNTGLLVQFLVGWLVASLFIHFAARIVLDHAHFGQALLTALVGTFAAAAAVVLLGQGALGLIVALALWALVAAAFYRTKWSRAAVIGLVAFALQYLVGRIVQWILDNRNG